MNVLWIFTLVALTSSCSLKDREVKYGVSFQLSQSAKNTFAQASIMNNAVVIASPSPSSSPTSTAPTSISGLQCFALNITGPGLASDPRFQCTNPEAKMGLMAGFVPVEGGKVEAMVPAGASRTIQLIGAQSTVGCPSFEQILASADPVTGKVNFNGIGDPYVLGSVTIDVYGDMTVNIDPVFDPLAKVFKDCGGGDQQQLTFKQPNGDYALQRQGCMRLDVEGHYHGTTMPATMPTVMPQVTSITGGTTVKLFKDPACTTGNEILPGDPMNFPANMPGFPIYVTADAATTGFKVQNKTTATDWVSPEVPFVLVANRLQLPSPAGTPVMKPPGAANCDMLNVSMVDSTGTYYPLPANQNFIMTVYNNSTNGTTPAAIKFYRSSTDCSDEVNAEVATWDGHRQQYIETFTATDMYLYYRTPLAENIGIEFSAQDHSMQPGTMYIMFNPFAFSAGVSSLIARDGGQTHGNPITLNFMEGGFNVEGVLINGHPCTIQSATKYAVTCVGSPEAPGTYPVQLVSAGVQYQTPLNVNYLPFKAGDGLTYPYEIDGANQLALLSDPNLGFSSKNFVQVASITDASMVFPQAGMPAIMNDFYGTYDGGMYSIANLSYPLFNNCSTGSQIRNLTLSGVMLNGSANQAAAVCLNLFGSLFNVNASGTINNSGGSSGVGGLVAMMASGSDIRNSVSSVMINSSGPGASVGGFVGMMAGGYIFMSASTGPVTSSFTGTTAYVGGLIGVMNDGQIDSTLATGNVQGYSIAGGLVGVMNTNTALVKNSIANGSVTSNTANSSNSIASGLVGQVNAGTISDSLSMGSVSGYSAFGFAQSNGSGIFNTSVAAVPTLTGTSKYMFTGSGGSSCYAIDYFSSSVPIGGAVSVASGSYSQGMFGTLNFAGYVWRSRNSVAPAAPPVPNWACTGANTPITGFTNFACDP